MSRRGGTWDFYVNTDISNGEYFRDFYQKQKKITTEKVIPALAIVFGKRIFFLIKMLRTALLEIFGCSDFVLAIEPHHRPKRHELSIRRIAICRIALGDGRGPPRPV